MICRFSGRDPCSALIAGLALAWPMTFTVTAPAQERPVQLAQSDKAEKLDALKQRDQDLKAARDAQSKSNETRSRAQT